MIGEKYSLGVLITDSSGHICFQSGLGNNPEIQKTIQDQCNKSGSSPRKLWALTTGGTQLVILARWSPEVSVFIIHENQRDETLFDFVASVEFSYAILNHLVSSPFQALTVVDAEAKVRYLSPIHEGFFGLPQGQAIGRPVSEVIENTRLDHVVKTGKAEIGAVQKMRGVNRVVSRVPIMQGNEIVGAIGQVMFKGPEQLLELSNQILKLKKEVTFYKRELSSSRRRTYGLEAIIGQSEAIKKLKSDIIKVASLDVSVLLVGESGTGKELVAHAIHGLSPRHDHPMVLVNAAALPASLIEAELFGYEVGAFTGADKKGRKGKFEQADKSSLFLDEIGEMPQTMQAKLLRVLQDGTFDPIGSDRSRKSDFRLISATNRDLRKMVNDNEFRLDLFYRISGVTLQIPSLIDRLDDIPLLVPYFLDAYCKRHRINDIAVHKDVYPFLREMPWPGNVRQLQHEVETAAIFSNGSKITVADFRLTTKEISETKLSDIAEDTGSMRSTVETVELNLIREAMVRHRNNKKKVAEELGISRSYLYKKLSTL